MGSWKMKMMGVHWKIRFLGGEGVWKTFFGVFFGGRAGESVKKGGLDSLQIYKGIWQKRKKERVMFLRWGGRADWDPNAH